MAKYFIISTAALLAAASSQASAQTVGVNAAVVNDVRMTTQANPAVHKAVVKERVSLGNDIVTGRASVLQVLLLDHTSFTVGGNARIKVDRFVYDPSRNASSVGLSVAKGAFRFISGKPLHANPGQSAIRTPIVSIGIRGTIVEGAIGEDAIRIARSEREIPQGFTADPENASLIFLRGPGAAAQGGEQPGAIDVTAGAITISVTGSGNAMFAPGLGQPLIGPFVLSGSGSAALSELLRKPRSDGAPFSASPLAQNPVVDLFFQAGEAYDQGPGSTTDPIQGP
ncbi:MAG: FecR domain-containing protein [Sphingomonas sp.]